MKYTILKSALIASLLVASLVVAIFSISSMINAENTRDELNLTEIQIEQLQEFRESKKEARN